MKIEDIPLTVMQKFQVAQVTLNSPSGPPERAVELIVQAAGSDSVKISRIRLSYDTVEALARSLSEVAELNPDTANRVHRVVSTATLAPITVTTGEGPKAAFLLTLKQKSLEGAAQLPVEVALDPELVISFAEMFLDTVGRHGLMRALAPSTTAPQ